MTLKLNDQTPRGNATVFQSIPWGHLFSSAQNGAVFMRTSKHQACLITDEITETTSDLCRSFDLMTDVYHLGAITEISFLRSGEALT